LPEHRCLSWCLIEYAKTLENGFAYCRHHPFQRRELPLFAGRPGNPEQIFLVVINPARFRPLEQTQLGRDTLPGRQRKLLGTPNQMG
jgi:hypothetical protein